MSKTLQELLDQTKIDLGDPASVHFTSAHVEQWLRDAIGDYSLHFPQFQSDSLNAVAGQHEYDLPADLLAVYSVEYPAGQTPRVYLQRRPATQPGFWERPGYYDLYPRADDTDPDQLVLSASPSAGESINVNYLARHDKEVALGAAVTAPSQHHHILRAYVLWRGALQQQFAEQSAPTANSSLLMSQLAVNADRLRRAYVDLLAKAVFVQSRAAAVSWQESSAEASRIY
ncbi:MAG: hypothetical protein ACRDHL_06375 [Candidatus Promineifilaceae bacterium]